MTEFERLLREKSAGLIDLSDAAVAQLGQHYDLLMNWGRRLNLTTIRNVHDVVERHYCESLFLANHIPTESGSLVDIGTGPGFPGVPIAAAHPALTVHLVESHSRKCVFLRESTRQFSNIRILETRSEDLGGQFEWLVSRAVKWDDLRAAALANAAGIAVLVGEADADSITNDPGGFVLKKPIKLPWGDHRFLLIGRVPRET
jgi:16S rRNA (guanine(527)-N(7))-methyltransferase RsmG